MDPLLIVSPHLDDVVLSCGQLMAGRPDCIVATVFAGVPTRPGMLTTYDRNCGYISADHAMRNRRLDDHYAVAMKLHGTCRHLDFPDHQYREVEATTVDPAAVTAALVEVVDADPAIEVVVGPLGMEHPDHLLVADAVRGMLRARPALQGWCYEDMPGRVLWPEQVPGRVDWWRSCGFDPVLGFLGTGPLEVKETAVACYGSQLWALNMHEVLVSERFHRLWAAT